MGALFATDPAVIGMDLRNEPHWYNPSPSGGGTNWQPANCAQYVRYAHWGPCNGLNNAATDWAHTATQAGNALLAINPRWLMFVEGGSTYPRNAAGTSFSKDGWGENLQGVASDSIVLQVPNRVVYAPHDYRWCQTSDTATNMYNTWNRTFGFVAVPGHSYTAPLWVGENGTCTQRNTCIMSTPLGTASYDEAGWWFNTFRFYLENACMTDPATGSPVCPAAGALGGPLNWSWWPANGIYVASWDESAHTSRPVQVCKRVRARRCRTIKGRAYCGYCAAKWEKFFGWRLHLVCTTTGLPGAFTLLPGGWHDLTPIHELTVGLPKGAWAYGDKGDNSAPDEAVIRATGGGALVPLHKDNMAPNTQAEQCRLRAFRLVIETVNSQLTAMSLAHLHVRFVAGLEIKVHASLRALACLNLD